MTVFDWVKAWANDVGVEEYHPRFRLAGTGRFPRQDPARGILQDAQTPAGGRRATPRDLRQPSQRGAPRQTVGHRRHRAATFARSRHFSPVLDARPRDWDLHRAVERVARSGLTRRATSGRPDVRAASPGGLEDRQSPASVSICRSRSAANARLASCLSGSGSGSREAGPLRTCRTPDKSSKSEAVMNGPPAVRLAAAVFSGLDHDPNPGTPPVQPTHHLPSVKPYFTLLFTSGTLFRLSYPGRRTDQLGAHDRESLEGTAAG